MRILGIDPGTAITGFCILDKKDHDLILHEYGCIRTAGGLNDSERLNQIAQDIQTIIKKWKPDKASVEKIFFTKNTKTAITVAQARGVILQNLEQYGISQKEYTPLEIKSAVCGNGKADKKMIQEMVKIIFNLKEIPQPDDAADAIAAAVCLANTMEIK